MAQARLPCYLSGMAFPRDLLAPHESIVFELRPHWVALIPSVFWTLVALALGIAGYALTEGTIANVILIVAVLGWLALALPPFLRWRFTLFVLTTDRLITRAGVFAKNSKELPLERLNDVAFNQTLVERMLGAGDLLIESAGERGQTRITNVRSPEQVQLKIYEESEKHQNRMFSQGRHAEDDSRRSPTVPEQLEALARLKDQGVLSDAEFQAKKQELL